MCCRNFHEKRARALSGDEPLLLTDACCALENIVKQPQEWLYRHNLVKKGDALEFVIWGDVVLYLRRVENIRGTIQNPMRKQAPPKSSKF